MTRGSLINGTEGTWTWVVVFLQNTGFKIIGW